MQCPPLARPALTSAPAAAPRKRLPVDRACVVSDAWAQGSLPRLGKRERRADPAYGFPFRPGTHCARQRLHPCRRRRARSHGNRSSQAYARDRQDRHGQDDPPQEHRHPRHAHRPRRRCHRSARRLLARPSRPDPLLPYSRSHLHRSGRSRTRRHVQCPRDRPAQQDRTGDRRHRRGFQSRLGRQLGAAHGAHLVQRGRSIDRSPEHKPPRPPPPAQG